MFKERLIKYLQAMQEAIVSTTGITEYITEKDIKEIKAYSEDYCMKIASNLRFLLGDTPACLVNDTRTNPWCMIRAIQETDSCIICTFGIRHGECPHQDSDHHKVSTRLKELFPEWSVHSINNIEGLCDTLYEIITSG